MEGERGGVEGGDEEGFAVSNMYSGKGEYEEDSASFLSSMGSMAPKGPAPDSDKYDDDDYEEDEGKGEQQGKAERPESLGFMAAELSVAAFKDEQRQMEKESQLKLKESLSFSTSSVKVKGAKGASAKGPESTTPSNVRVGEAGFEADYGDNADNADERPSTPQHRLSERMVGDLMTNSMDTEVKRLSPEPSQTTVASGKESGGGVASTDDDGGYGEEEFEDF